ncbi:MAG TPA: polyprenyl synthetase family protein [Nitrososphaera sp.]|jgi:geranylgeranyl diphosphate synthase type I
MKASSIKGELESYASTVNEYILSCLDGKPKELYQASSHLIRTGGKRLRPFMVIKSCEMLGGTVKRAIPAAASIELVHNFTLVHDDIMDNDEMRHGTATVHRSYGMPLAILAGDILFSKSFELLTYNCRKVGIADKAISQMVGRMSIACTEICEGQAIDIGVASSSRLPTESDYIDMIGKKTAALFKMSCALGALSAPNYTDRDIKNLSSFGHNIGIAFQLVDDLIGVVGDPKLTGKAAGNDLREGKKTYPILLALENAREKDRDKLRHVFGARERATSADIREAVRIISDIGIEREVRDAAKKYMIDALRAIENYADSDAKRSLKFSADFVVGRSL